jgi:hypothetical protein
MTVWHEKIITTRWMVQNFKMKQMQQFYIWLVLHGTWFLWWTVHLLTDVQIPSCKLSHSVAEGCHSRCLHWLLCPWGMNSTDDTFIIPEYRCHNFYGRQTCLDFLDFWRSWVFPLQLSFTGLRSVKWCTNVSLSVALASNTSFILL